MAVFKNTIITNQGRQLLSNALANSKRIVFTRLETSDYVYEDGENLENLINLNNVKQSINVSNIEQNQTVVTLRGVFTNRDVTEPYLIQTIGCYGKIENGNEILYSITRAKTADTMPANNGVNLSTIEVELVTEINNDNGAIIEFNPNALITKNSLATNTEAGIVTLNKISEMISTQTPQGTTSVSGKVQLSSATNSTDETKASTPKAVKDTMDRANSAYAEATKNATDTQAGRVTLNQIRDKIRNEAPAPSQASQSVVGITKYGTDTGTALEGNRLAEIIGLPFGGNIQDSGNKTTGKFYYDTATKQYYECVVNNNLTYNESSKFVSVSSKYLSDKLRGLEKYENKEVTLNGTGGVSSPYFNLITLGKLKMIVFRNVPLANRQSLTEYDLPEEFCRNTIDTAGVGCDWAGTIIEVIYTAKSRKLQLYEQATVNKSDRQCSGQLIIHPQN